MPLRPGYTLADKDGKLVKPDLGHRSLRNRARAKQALRDENPIAAFVMQRGRVVFHKKPDGTVVKTKCCCVEQTQLHCGECDRCVIDDPCGYGGP